MRIFITGGSGFVGSAVVEELVKAGHEVIGLARSADSEKKLLALGAKPLRGSMNEHDILRNAASEADAVIHCAFNHDFFLEPNPAPDAFKKSLETDAVVIDVLAQGLRGTDRPLLITSGVGMRNEEVLTEKAERTEADIARTPRAATEVAAARAAKDLGVRVSILRLPIVHGDGDQATVPILINIAKATGKSAYVADGANAWSAVHRRDAADAYRLIVENPNSRGIYHGVAEPVIPFKDIAGFIARGLGVPAVSLDLEQAKQHFGGFFHFAAMDARASSELTRQSLGWTPRHFTLSEDLEKGKYFTAA